MGRAIGICLALSLCAAAPAMAQNPTRGWRLPMRASQVTPVQRAAILRAAGYVQRRGHWVMRDCAAPGTIDDRMEGGGPAIRDLNGDGNPEVIVTASSFECFGNTGQAFQLLTATPTGWRLLLNEMGIPVIHRRAGAAWPDIDIGGPGICFPRVRWNGQTYVSAGNFSEDQPCSVD